MNRRFGSFAIFTAAIGFACGPTSHRGSVDPAPPHASPSAQAAITPPSLPTTPRAVIPPLSRAFLALRGMTQENACAIPTTIPGTPARKNAKPFDAPETHCDSKSGDYFCDTVDIASKGANACFISNDHIRSAQKWPMCPQRTQPGQTILGTGQKSFTAPSKENSKCAHCSRQIEMHPVSVTLLDHHSDPLAATITRPVDEKIVVFPFRFPEIPE